MKGVRERGTSKSRQGGKRSEGEKERRGVGVRGANKRQKFFTAY